MKVKFKEFTDEQNKELSFILTANDVGVLAYSDGRVSIGHATVSPILVIDLFKRGILVAPRGKFHGTDLGRIIAARLN